MQKEQPKVGRLTHIIRQKSFQSALKWGEGL